MKLSDHFSSSQGHEEAVRHLVEAVQETRKKEAAKQRQHRDGDDTGCEREKRGHDDGDDDVGGFGGEGGQTGEQV